MANLLALDERHQNLWGEAQGRPDLKRILSKEVHVLTEPVTIEENEFLQRVILYFETGWRLEKIMDRGELKILALDAGEFFSLPLPRAVWEKTKQFRNPRFVRFVEKAMKGRA